MKNFQLYILLFIFPFLHFTNSDCKNVESDQNYIAGDFTGQLGNQLFGIATTLAYAWDNDLIPVFPFLNINKWNRPFNRDHMFFRLNHSKPNVKFSNYKDLEVAFIPIPSGKKNVRLIGSFYSWKHFHHHREKILETLAPSQEILSYLHEKYGDLIAHPKTVGVHVRTTSREIHNTSIPFPGLTYFGIAMDHFPDDCLFVVFSDRIKWCKKNFMEKFPSKNFVFIEGNNHIQDLFLLSMMKNHVLSNLTFSWWGAYLNTNPEHIVFVPNCLSRYHANWPIEDYYLPEWHIVDYDFRKEPYPKDMYWYDEESQSLDEKHAK